MKTPRELLVGQHRETEARLDTIRQEIVQAMAEPTNELTSRDAGDIGFLGTCWQELFVACRRYWMGLGAAWALVVIFIGAGALSDGNGRAMARTNGSTLDAMQAQLQLRNELLGVVAGEEARVSHRDAGPRSDVIREDRYV